MEYTEEQKGTLPCVTSTSARAWVRASARSAGSPFS